VVEFAALCDEFEMEAFKQQVGEFVNANRGLVLLPLIKGVFEQGRDTSSFKKGLKQRLFDFLDNRELVDLSLSCLARVISFPNQLEAKRNRTQFDRIFDICIRIFDEIGSGASILFRGLDLKQCTIEQLHKLHSRLVIRLTFTSLDIVQDRNFRQVFLMSKYPYLGISRSTIDHAAQPAQNP
jgi:hypothetical protein